MNQEKGFQALENSGYNMDKERASYLEALEQSEDKEEVDYNV